MGLKDLRKGEGFFTMAVYFTYVVVVVLLVRSAVLAGGVLI
jgi:hypothetical protein